MDFIAVVRCLEFYVIKLSTVCQSCQFTKKVGWINISFTRGDSEVLEFPQIVTGRRDKLLS